MYNLQVLTRRASHLSQVKYRVNMRFTPLHARTCPTWQAPVPTSAPMPPFLHPWCVQPFVTTLGAPMALLRIVALARTHVVHARLCLADALPEHTTCPCHPHIVHMLPASWARYCTPITHATCASVVPTKIALANTHGPDGYYVAYKPITLSCILLMFIEMKFIYCHSCVMFAMKSMSMCND